VAAAVANGIHVVVNAHDSDIAAFDSELPNLARRDVG
jgi:hypothetical protein